MKTTTRFIALSVSLLFTQTFAGEILVIGNSNLAKMDTVTIQKIYTGKFISVAGVNVTPVAVKPGTISRNKVLNDFLNQDEEKYTAYWIVRRYIGKGVPPTELDTAGDVIRYVQANPGAIGYIEDTEFRQGMNVIARQ